MEKRRTLKNGIGVKKSLNMPKIYKELDKGRSVKSVAKEWGVSPSTLYRRHHEYQAELERNLKESDFPPLPEELVKEIGELSELLDDKL